MLVLWIPRVEGQNLASIGLGPFKLRYLGIGLLSYIALLVLLAGTGFALQAIGLEGIRGLQPTLKGYATPVLLGLFITGPFLEEPLHRGYVIERASLLTGRGWLAGAISWLSFTLVHFKWVGLGPMLEIGVMSAVLVFLYLRERSSWPCVVLHGINSAFAYILFPLPLP